MSGKQNSLEKRKAEFEYKRSDRFGYTREQRAQNYEDLSEQELEQLARSRFGDNFQKAATRQRGRELIAKHELETGRRWTGPVPPEWSKNLRPPQNRLNDADEREAGIWGTTSRSPYDGAYQSGCNPERDPEFQKKYGRRGNNQ